jgi:hypothetical protein
MVSQPVALQVGSVMLHGAMQQLPIPVVPQAPERQESFSVQALPGVSWATQAEDEHQNPTAQSVTTAQLVLQVVGSAQPKLPGQSIEVPATQVPMPSQALAVRTPPSQPPMPHIVVFGG